MIWCYYNNKCSFCFKFFEDNIDYMEDHQPISEIKVAACGICRKDQLLCKTHLKKMYCSTDHEINRLTSYNLKNESRKVYFYTEFLALCDEQFNENMDSELKTRRDKRDKLAQNYLKRIMNTEKSQKEVLAERLVKEAGCTEEKAKRITNKINNDIKTQIDSIVLDYKLRKEAIKFFTEIANREPSKSERKRVKNMRDYSSLMNAQAINKDAITNFVLEINKKKEILKVANEVLKEKTQDKYTRVEDLPRTIRQQYQQLLQTNARTPEISKDAFEDFFNKECLEKLDREAGIAALLEDSGFRASTIDYTSSVNSYIGDPKSEFKMTEVTKEAIENSTQRSDLISYFQRLDRNSRESLIMELLDSIVYKKTFGGETMREKLTDDLGRSLLESKYKKYIHRTLVDKYMKITPTIQVEEKKSKKSGSSKKKKDTFLVSSDEEEEKPKKKETKKKGKKRKAEEEEDEEVEVVMQASSSADAATSKTKRKSSRTPKKKKTEVDDDLDMLE